MTADAHPTDPAATAHSADSPTLHTVPVQGLNLAAFEWRAHRRGQGPTLWLVHATGFHGRVWDEVVRRLPGHHVVAPEQRGHGRSQAAPFSDWAPFGDDMAALADAFDLQGAVGVGHSMGAHALVQAAAQRPGRFSQLILIDPVILSPADYAGPPTPVGELHPSAQRKSHFESAQAMVARFSGRPPYSVFTPQALRDYCEHGLRPADDGLGWQLACAPAFEGQVYPLARNRPAILAEAAALDIPVLVLRARPQDPSVRPWDALGTPTWAGLAATLRHGEDLQWADRTHFMPMEDPDRVAALISDRLARPAR